MGGSREVGLPRSVAPGQAGPGARDSAREVRGANSSATAEALWALGSPQARGPRVRVAPWRGAPTGATRPLPPRLQGPSRAARHQSARLSPSLGLHPCLAPKWLISAENLWLCLGLGGGALERLPWVALKFLAPQPRAAARLPRDSTFAITVKYP